MTDPDNNTSEKTGETKTYQCGLCGVTFTQDEAQSACSNCPFARFCSLVKCPNCGYEFPA